MKLAFFTAGIDIGRQIGEELRVELPSGKRLGQLLGINAGNTGAQTRLNHFICQLSCRHGPNWENRRNPCFSEALLPIAADIFQKKVAKGDSTDSLPFRPFDGSQHSGLILCIAARAGNRNLPERKPDCLGLHLQKLDSHRVHRHPRVDFVDGCQQPDHFYLPPRF